MSEYPHYPGHRGGDTEAAAALAVESVAATCERMALAEVRARPLTADEVHAVIECKLGRSVPLYSVRPRLSALKAKGLVVDTGERRLSSAGRCKQRVFRAATPEERAQRSAETEAKASGLIGGGE